MDTKRLLSILEKEKAVYGSILELAREKSEILKKNDIVSLKKVVSQMNEFIGQIDALEQERKKVMGDFCRDRKIAAEKVTITMIAEECHEPALLTIKKEIRALLEELEKISERNNLLIRQAQTVYDTLGELLYKNLVSIKGYNARGNIESSQGGYFEHQA